MKIGLTTSLIRHGRSGVAQYVFGLVRAWMASRPPHTLILFVLEHDVPLFAFARGVVQIVQVSERHRSPWRDFFWHQTTLPRLARQLGLDVLHVPAHRRFVAHAPCPCVGTVADAAAFRPAVQRGAGLGSVRWALFRLLARQQQRLIALSPGAAETIGQCCGVGAERFAVIPPGVDRTTFFPGDRERAVSRIARQHGLLPPYFIYPARLEQPGKNHARLIAAFNAFKTSTPSPWQLVLLGGDGYGAEKVHELVERSPYAPDIHRVGHVAAEDLADWYRAAGALVYPPRREGFGLPALEAMACGCPVLLSTAGAPREVCGDAVITVDPRDVATLRLRLADLAFDPALREHLREAGLARAAGFTWERTAAATLAAYEATARWTPAAAIRPSGPARVTTTAGSRWGNPAPHASRVRPAPAECAPARLPATDGSPR